MNYIHCFQHSFMLEGDKGAWDLQEPLTETVENFLTSTKDRSKIPLVHTSMTIQLVKILKYFHSCL